MNNEQELGSTNVYFLHFWQYQVIYQYKYCLKKNVFSWGKTLKQTVNPVRAQGHVPQE